MSKKLTCRTCSHFRAKGVTLTHGDVPYDQCRRYPAEVFIMGDDPRTYSVASFFSPIEEPDHTDCGEHRGLAGKR